MLQFAKSITAIAVASFLAFPAKSAAVVAQPDSLTSAAATILGTALKGSIEQIEQLGVTLDHPALMKMLGEIVDGRQPDYTYEEAYAVIDNYVNAAERAYIDSVFSPEAQQIFVDQAAAQPGALRQPSGLVFQVLTEGEGVNPASGDDVVINYEGRLSDGSVFDATEGPVTFDVDHLVPGFTEGLKLMKPGGKYRIVIPASLGYGERGVPGAIPPGAALDFTIDLIQILPKPLNP